MYVLGVYILLFLILKNKTYRKKTYKKDHSCTEIMGMKKGETDPTSKTTAKNGYFELHCNRCDHVWYSTRDPKTCSNVDCKSPYWNKIRIR